MKKFITISAFALVSLTANATLSNNCKYELDKVVALNVQTEQEIDAGEMGPRTANSLFRSYDDSAETIALACAGKKLLELERSLTGKLGLISKEKADQVSDMTYQEAWDYYLKSVIH